MREARGARLSVALLHWGDLIEDFLDTIGVSLDGFRTALTGGWMFGYVEALRRADVETALVCFSRGVRRPVRTRHGPTGAPLWLLPPSLPYRALRRRLRDPLAWTPRDAIGEGGRAGRTLGRAAFELAPYLATPLGALGRTLRREGCGALLCQEYEHPRFDACVLLGALARVPVFATFQGGDTHRVVLERLFRLPAIRACRGLVVGSSSEAERLRSHYRVRDDKLARIFNPVDVTLWGGADRVAVRAELGIPPDSRVVGWHGRVAVTLKGLDLLIEAWRALAAARPGTRDVRLLLVGTGDDAPELRRRLEGIRDGVLWIDEYVLDRARIARYLAAADVYAFPSRREGFPVSPVEAMACGLPVVAADVHGVADIFEDGEASGGVIVPRDDAQALGAALTRLLDDEESRRELGRQARRRARTAFSLEAVGTQLHDFMTARGLRPRAPTAS